MNNKAVHITLLENIHENAVTALKQAGFSQVELLDTALDGDALDKQLEKTDVIGIRSRTQLTREVLEKAPHLKAIGCFCIGTNQVDVDAAQELGIPVFNAPYSNTRSVAELVICEIIALLRGLPSKSAAVHNGTWPKQARGAFEARGKTLGIVGYGNIGTQVSVLAESMGMKVIFYDVLTKLPLGNAEAASSMDDLLQRSDVVSLHVPQLPSTKNIIKSRELYLMKKGAILINAARGHCVEIDDLAEAISSGHLGGAAIDVFPTEPKSNDEPLDSPLRGLDNVILTPHIGGSTVEAQANIGLEVAEKFAQFLDNGYTVSAVNFPEIALPRQVGTLRILHIHKNRPGVLSAINRLFAEHDINISAQSLITKGEIGYLVMDVNQNDAAVALEQIKSIEGTIRARLLYQAH
ncbi:phosphoglycerate dehydrogenase [Cardiobacteriaceae bacterium TAE3-ERU3]|nr:phosphoglycerate dehydrogenase [Cardiobacteriaceae bacterium TAE3-ERU3]